MASMKQHAELSAQLARCRTEWKALRLSPDERKTRLLISHVRYWRTKLELSLDALRLRPRAAHVELELEWRQGLMEDFDELLVEMGVSARRSESQQPLPTVRTVTAPREAWLASDEN